MKLFLTGSSGFLGRHIFERWDGDIYLYSRNEGLNGLLSFEPEVIIHAAAEIYDTGKMFDSNLRLTYNLLESARLLKHLKAFIYIGSSSEYGRKEEPMKEDDVLVPQTLYEATKGAGTLLSQAYASTYGLPVMVARPFSLYGKYEPKKRLIPTAIRNAKGGWEMEIAPGVHDFIHVDDFIDGLLTLIDKGKPGEVYNFGTGKQLSNEEVVGIVEEVVGRKVVRKAVGQMRPYDSSSWVANIDKAKSLGWKPKISFYQGITRLCHT